MASRKRERAAEYAPVPRRFISDVLDFLTRWQDDLATRHQPSGLIYHYCDANALLNIFRSKHLWATGTRYLNDETELISLFKNLEEHKKRHVTTPVGRKLFKLAEVAQHHGAHLL